ncbi:glutamine synthetase family protein [Anderseniella sp. Alg231-50]|uniref:glutamine synthetase family protein n=1 Tax=Anderseniella sp. Alg231-50 TaxID=1922226 RepID=UPI00307B6EE1
MSDVGREGLAALAGMDSADRRTACATVLEQIENHGLDTVRLAFVDQHGVLRGKTLMAAQAAGLLANGCAMTSTLLAKDTSHRTVFPVWQAGAGLDMAEMEGAGDMMMLPDPETFRVLPWVEGCGWLLCDLFFTDGKPVPFCVRRKLRDAEAELANRELDIRFGLEAEFHILQVDDWNRRPEDAGQPGAVPDVSLMTHGFQYLTEARGDQLEPVTEVLRKACVALNLPVRSIECEFGPSQVEFTFAPMQAVQAADAMTLFRSMVKQVCRRQGLHATFMCRPQVANLFASGWHVHQSLLSATSGDNLFTPEAGSDLLSLLGLHYTAGLLAHAVEASVFAAPTINGYKRYKSFQLAPDRAIWGRDNKGVMVRAIGGPGDPATRVENRAAEAAANPYLHLAAQVWAGLQGIDDKRDPGPAADTPYKTDATMLPTNLMDAVDALEASQLFRRRFGEKFVDYLIHIKRAEIARFLSEVTDWEHREYFDLY